MSTEGAPVTPPATPVPLQWKDLTKVEDPFEYLEVDPVRWDPIGTQSRLERCTNALCDLYRQLGEINTKIANLKGVRSGDEYHGLRAQAIPLEKQIEALEKKWETLKNRSYVKNQEYNHTQ